MSYKYFGKLAGTTPASETLADTSPANTTTPFKPHAPATKFMAYGEDATSSAFNRAFSALSANIDSVKGTLDAPAMREEVLSPVRDSTDLGGSSAGFWPLGQNSALNPNGVQTYQDAIDLAGSANPNTVPPVWVYCGLHQRELENFIRLFGSEEGKTLWQSRGNTSLKHSLSPVNVSAKLGVPEYFQPTEYQGDDEHALPLTIPPITPINAEISPYNGTAITIDIHRWESDGLTIRSTGLGFHNLSLRPGCYVEVQNDGDPSATGNSNNGLYQITAVQQSEALGAGGTGDKAVLTRGNLAKVTVGDYTTFSDGDLVSWKAYPDHANAASLPEERTLYAHVVYRIPRPDLPEVADVGDVQGDLYLAPLGAGEDFNTGIGGTANKVAQSGFQKNGRRAYGDVGLPDMEEGAQSNWTMPKKTPTSSGTMLFRYDSGAGAWESEEVTDVVAPSAPVSFVLDSNPGHIVPCTPLGFLLNPVLIFEGPGADRHTIQQDYYLYCNTLTTVGEQLRSQGASATRGSYEAPASKLNWTYGDIRLLRDHLSHLSGGYLPVPGPQGARDYMLNGPFNPTQQTLGNDLLYIQTEHTGPGPNTTIEDFLTAQGIHPGDRIPLHTFAQNQAHPAHAAATLVRASDNMLVCRGLVGRALMPDDHPANWTGGLAPYYGTGSATYTSSGNLLVESQDMGGGSPTQIYGISFGGAENFVVSKLYGAPIVENKHTPGEYANTTFGLNAAYHADFSSNEELRGQQGAGHKIAYAANSRPISIIFPQEFSNQTVFRTYTNLPESHDLNLVEMRPRSGAFAPGVGPWHGAIGWQVMEYTHAYLMYAGKDNAIAPNQVRTLIFQDTRGADYLSEFSHIQNGGWTLSDEGWKLPLTSPDTHRAHTLNTKTASANLGVNENYYGVTTAYEPHTWSGEAMPHRINTGTPGNQPSITEGIEAALPGMYVPKGKYAGNSDLKNNFGVYSNGLIKGANQHFQAYSEDDFGNAVDYTQGNAAHSVDFSECWYLKGGAKVFHPETRLCFDGWVTGSYYVRFFFDTDMNTQPNIGNMKGSYLIIPVGTAFASFGMTMYDEPNGFLVCLVDYDSTTGVQAVYDARQRVSREDQKNTLYVGNTGSTATAFVNPMADAWSISGSYPSDQTHFKTLGAAFKAIEIWEMLQEETSLPAPSSDGAGTRKWTIEVVGWTYEGLYPQRGESYPLKVPADGLTVIGHPTVKPAKPVQHSGETAAGMPMIHWGYEPDPSWSDTGVEQNLIDINAKSGLVFKNLSFTWGNHAWQENSAVNTESWWWGGPSIPTWNSNHDFQSGINLFINRTEDPSPWATGNSGRAYPVYTTNSRASSLDPVHGNDAMEVILNDYQEIPGAYGSRDVTIDNVHLLGGTGFFHHMDYIAMDRLTIRNCVSKTTTTFVTIAPQYQFDVASPGSTLPTYHSRILIEDNHATCSEVQPNGYGFEIYNPHGVLLCSCPDYVVRNNHIEGFIGRGIFVPQPIQWAGLDLNDDPLTDQLQESWGRIEGNTLIRTGWESVATGTSKFGAGTSVSPGARGMTKVLNNTIIDHNSLPLHVYNEGTIELSLGIWAQNVSCAAIRHQGMDITISGNVIERVGGENTWPVLAPGAPQDEPNFLNSTYHPLIVVSGGYNNIWGPNKGDGFLDEYMASNVQIKDNVNKSTLGHTFIHLYWVDGAQVSGNMEQSYNWPYQVQGVSSLDEYAGRFASVQAETIRNVDFSNNQFGSYVTYGAEMSGTPSTRCFNIRFVNNNVYANQKNAIRFGGAPGGEASPALMAAEHNYVAGNRFNGCSVNLTETFGRTMNTVFSENDMSFHPDPDMSMYPVADQDKLDHLGGSIFMTAPYAQVDGSRIVNNHTGGGNISVMEFEDNEIQTLGQLRYPSYAGVVVSGNNTLYSRFGINRNQDPATWELGYIPALIQKPLDGASASGNISGGWNGLGGSDLGGYVQLGCYPRNCKVTSNIVGYTSAYIRGAIAVGTWDGAPDKFAMGGVHDEYIVGANTQRQSQARSNEISDNMLTGGHITTAGKGTIISRNTGVGAIMHNCNYQPALSSFQPHSRRGGASSIIKDNVFLGKNEHHLAKMTDEEDYFGAGFNWGLWGPFITIGQGEGSVVSGNVGAKLLFSVRSNSLTISDNKMHGMATHTGAETWDETDLSGYGDSWLADCWNGRLGLSFGMGGWIQLRGNHDGLQLSNNDLVSQQQVVDLDDDPFMANDAWGWFIGDWGTGGVPSTTLPSINGAWANTAGTVEGVDFYAHADLGDGGFSNGECFVPNSSDFRISRARVQNNWFMRMHTDEMTYSSNMVITGNIFHANDWFQGAYAGNSAETRFYRDCFDLYNKGMIFNNNKLNAGVYVGVPVTVPFDGSATSGTTPSQFSGAYGVLVGNKGGGRTAFKVTGGSVASVGNNLTDWGNGYKPGWASATAEIDARGQTISGMDPESGQQLYQGVMANKIWQGHGSMVDIGNIQHDNQGLWRGAYWPNKPGIAAETWADYSEHLSMTPTVGIAHVVHRQSNTDFTGPNAHNSWADAETATALNHDIDWPNINPASQSGYGGAGDNAFQKWGSTTKWFWAEDAEVSKRKAII